MSIEPLRGGPDRGPVLARPSVTPAALLVRSAAANRSSPGTANDILDYELWRRAADREDAVLSRHLAPEDQKLFALVLSLARLCAQRDAKGGEA